ncbi:MAG: hypothetical protein KAU03_05930, partial [Candidatus Altiarchaeales archaeon]|nr:hypothetical protein [Candidatus Altiarchaeales archaeon]
DLPSEALEGDVFAVSVLLILFYLAVILINKLTDIIILVLKKVSLFIIVLLAFYRFLQIFSVKLGSDGLTNDTLVLGGVGLVVGFIALMIAFHAAFSSLREIRHKAGEDAEAPEVKEGEAKKVPEAREVEAKEKVKKPAAQGIISMKSLKDDKKLGVVIAYLVVAEFGVISSKTVSAPNVAVGIIFLVVFILAALFFIHQSYSDYSRGMRHLLVAFVVGGILSVILGHFWGGEQFNELFSEAYFMSDSLVAFVTGIAVSLFMGSKG